MDATTATDARLGDAMSVVKACREWDRQTNDALPDTGRDIADYVLRARGPASMSVALARLTRDDLARVLERVHATRRDASVRAGWDALRALWDAGEIPEREPVTVPKTLAVETC